MAMLIIRGATLAGMACAARLAKLGHEMELHCEGLPPGGVWSAERDHLAPVFTLPATWRDLFKKSGRPLDAELARDGLAMVEAPPATHRFADGSELTLPTERGRQFAVLSERYGTPVAESWRDLLDELNEVWFAARRHGVERPTQPQSRRERSALWMDRTLADAADRAGHPHLAQLVLSLGPLAGTRSRRAPGLLASRLVIERTFGRWHLAEADGAALPGTRMIDVLLGRLATRKVRLVEGSPSGRPAIDCVPGPPAFGLRAALAPTSTVRWEDGPPDAAVGEVVDHTGKAPVVTWTIPTSAGVAVHTRDFAAAHRSAEWGLEPRSARAVLRRPPVVGEHLSASVSSPAGPEPWAELASAALAVYELHERLTGEDSRPTNRKR